MRERYPGTPVVTYVNTSAEVKAESDICCTSGNAVQIVKRSGAERIIFLPDEYLAKYVASQVPEVEVIAWKGHCEVHERFTARDIRRYREDDPTLKVLAHPECPPDVLAEADYVGSTAGMNEYVGELAGNATAPRVVMITECSMADNVAVLYPSVDFVRPCNLVPAHEAQLACRRCCIRLQTMQYEVTIDPAVADARASGRRTHARIQPAACMNAEYRRRHRRRRHCRTDGGAQSRAAAKQS